MRGRNSSPCSSHCRRAGEAEKGSETGAQQDGQGWAQLEVGKWLNKAWQGAGEEEVEGGGWGRVKRPGLMDAGRQDSSPRRAERRVWTSLVTMIVKGSREGRFWRESFSDGET